MAGVLAWLVADRLRVPALVLFLGVGMAIGSDGTGWIDFGHERRDYELTRFVGSIALALILFEGGLAAGLSALRPVLGPAITLALIGTLGTAAITGLAASLLFDLSLLQGLLLGAILSASDGAAVFAILRRSTLRPRLTRTLEGEAGLNDPVAVLLVLACIGLIEQPGYGMGDAAVLFVGQLGIGAVIGVGLGSLAATALRRAATALSPGMLLVASCAVAALAFGAAGALHGSGFLAVYLAGLVVGNVAGAERASLTAFHDGLGSVAEISLFFVLGLLVFPGEFGGVLLEGTLLALVVACVARPIATAIATAGTSFDAHERVVLGWAGLRGAVPVVLATFPVIDGVPRSIEFFNIVFFAVLVSTVLQGTTLTPLARRLGVMAQDAPRP